MDRDTEYKRLNVFKVLAQWVFLPCLSCAIGVIGTYHNQVIEIRDRTNANAKDITMLSNSIKDERDERKTSDGEIGELLRKVVSLDTEVITLFRVQQQAIIPNK